MITLSNNCSGCSACFAICPKNAIEMKYDSEGFLSPVIDRSKCIECHKCENVCPMEKTQYFNSTIEYCYAAVNKDEKARFTSSSGAVFPLLANYILENDGYVCGAAVDNELVTRHIIVSNQNKKYLKKIYGSKYVQSDMNTVFVQVKKLLDENKTVLFSGTPCQVAGLKSFLGKEYEKLLTVDIICHGTPSPGVLKLYLSEVGAVLPKISGLSFRDKALGWRSVKLTFTDDNDTIFFSERIGENPYLKAFQQNAVSRLSCHSCPFTKIFRVSDITLGDFWKITELSPNYKDNRGTSLIFCNSPKGESVYTIISKSLSKSEKFPVAEVQKRQINLRKPTPKSPLRDRVFDLYRQYLNKNTVLLRGKNFSSELSRLFIPVGILNFFDADNFGAVLVPYALSRLVNKAGYKAEIINYRSKQRLEKTSEHFEAFREKFLPLSPIGHDVRFLKSVLRRYQKVITGADQVFRMRNTGVYMLNWVSQYKNLISYAASFGTTEYTGSIPLEEVRMLLKRFDALSVREKEAISICKSIDIQATHVLDPVLMLDAKDYDEIIAQQTEDIVPAEDMPYVGCVFLGDTRKQILNNKSIIKDIRKKYKLVNVVREKDGKLRSIQEYLSLIKNSQYILTNSFHGLVLAIVFKKNFITVVNLDPSRQQSLLSILGIPDERLVYDLQSISLQVLEKELNYKEIYMRLNEWRMDSFEFLVSALRIPISYKEDIPVSQKFEIAIGEKKTIFTLCYEQSQKRYYADKYGLVYAFSLDSGKSFLNGTVELNRNDSILCEDIFAFLEKGNVNKVSKAVLKLSNNIMENSQLFSDMKNELNKVSLL